jgi:hypothetical protein
MPTNVTKLKAQKTLSLSRFTKAINNPCVLFSVISLLLTAIVMFRFPSLGAIVAEYNQF